MTYGRANAESLGFGTPAPSAGQPRGTRPWMSLGAYKIFRRFIEASQDEQEEFFAQLRRMGYRITPPAPK